MRCHSYSSKEASCLQLVHNIHIGYYTRVAQRMRSTLTDTGLQYKPLSENEQASRTLAQITFFTAQLSQMECSAS